MFRTQYCKHCDVRIVNPPKTEPGEPGWAGLWVHHPKPNDWYVYCGEPIEPEAGMDIAEPFTAEQARLI